MSLVVVGEFATRFPGRASRAISRFQRFTHFLFPYIGWQRRTRFLYRATTHWQQTAIWQAALAREPMAWLPGPVKVDLLQKIYRPFSRHGLDIGERVALLQAHYETLGRVLSRPVFDAIVHSTGLQLSCLVGRDGWTYSLSVRRDNRFGKEGELSFCLRDDRLGIDIASLTGVIDIDSIGRRVLSVGGLQGPKPPHGRDEVVGATRMLDGLRPKRAVLEAACAFAAELGIEFISAASAERHVSGARRRAGAPIRADYDEFWLECGAVATPSGDFCLSTRLVRREAEEVPARKRKAWRVRRRHLDDIAAGTRAALDQVPLLDFVNAA